LLRSDLLDDLAGAGRGGRWRTAWAALFVSAGGSAGSDAAHPGGGAGVDVSAGWTYGRGRCSAARSRWAGGPPRPSAAGPGPHPGGGADSVVSARWRSVDEVAAPLRAVAGWGGGLDVAARVQRPMDLTARPPLLRRAGRPAAHRGVGRCQTLRGASRPCWARHPVATRRSFRPRRIGMSLPARSSRSASTTGPRQMPCPSAARYREPCEMRYLLGAHRHLATVVGLGTPFAWACWAPLGFAQQPFSSGRSWIPQCSSAANAATLSPASSPSENTNTRRDARSVPALQCSPLASWIAGQRRPESSRARTFRRAYPVQS
jgi:hypothetical protein